MSCLLSTPLCSIDQNIDALYALFFKKTTQPEEQSYGLTRDSDLESKQYIFLKNEIIFFSETNQSNVISMLNNIGVDLTVVNIVVHDDPVFFVEKETEDHTKSADYFLTHSDLPYGFAGPGGLFQFSTPELINLKKSADPVLIDNVYLYLDTNPMTYEKISNKENEKICRPVMNGLGWSILNSKQKILEALDQGRSSEVVANITLESPDGSIFRLNFMDEKYYREALKRQPENLPYTYFHIPPGVGNYNPSKFIGWSFSFNFDNTKEFQRELFNMPPNQLSTFEVNPFPQTPYRGAEGVYPVILVEFLRDVVITL